MMCKDHFIANICTVSIIGCGYYNFQQYVATNSATIIKPLGDVVTYMVNSVVNPQCNLHPVVWYVGCMCLFLLGTWLPDIDKRLPIEHRTWTHAIWIPAGLFFLSHTYHMLFWLAFGYVLHLFWDSISYAGVCYLYPFTKYRNFGSGAKVNQQHIFKLYRVGKPSEYVLIGVLVTITCLIVGITIWNCLT